MELTHEQQARVDELVEGGMDPNVAVIAATSPVEGAADILAGMAKPKPKGQQDRHQDQQVQARIENLKKLYHQAKTEGRPMDAVSIKSTLWNSYQVAVN